MLVIIAVVLLGVGGNLIYEHNKKPIKPKTAAEAVKSVTPVSTPGDEYDKSLVDFANSTTSPNEKYKAYVSLCNSYDMKAKLDLAKEFCNKAVAIADQAGIKGDEKAAIVKLADYVSAKADYAAKVPKPASGGYSEPAE